MATRRLHNNIINCDVHTVALENGEKTEPNEIIITLLLLLLLLCGDSSAARGQQVGPSEALK